MLKMESSCKNSPGTKFSKCTAFYHHSVSPDRAIELAQGVIPGRINQDVLENWFGHHWQAGGSSQNTCMTGMPSNYAFQLHNITFEAESSLIYEHVYFQVVKAWFTGLKVIKVDKGGNTVQMRSAKCIVIGERKTYGLNSTGNWVRHIRLTGHEKRYDTQRPTAHN